MPPKRGKKAAPATPALGGCKIAFSGTFGVPQTGLKTKAEALGAAVASTVSDDVTHLVATEADYKKPSSKVAKAQSLGIHIVDLSWLSDSEQNNAKQPEDDHVPGGSDKNDTTPGATSKQVSSQADATASTTTRSRKRTAPPASANASDNEAAPQPKKTRGRKTAPAANADEADDVKMQDSNGTVDAEPEVKKEKGKGKAEPAMGAGQVAKRKDIQIPLDEGCPFVTSAVYIDDSGIIYDASLNQTNASNNNNKFYRVQVRPTHATFYAISDRLVAFGGYERRVQDVDSMGPRRRARPDSSPSHGLAERRYAAV
jgi:poly [ADP-ribose] polymerase